MSHTVRELEIVRLRKHLWQSSEIITDAQAILTRYLEPGGHPTDAINDLLTLLDNREIVARQAEWAAALARDASLG